MLVGFNTLVLGGEPATIGDDVVARLAALGEDGDEVPVVDAGPATDARLGRRLDSHGLARAFVTIIPDETRNSLSADAAVRRRAVDRLARALDCGHALVTTIGWALLVRLPRSRAAPVHRRVWRAEPAGAGGRGGPDRPDARRARRSGAGRTGSRPVRRASTAGNGRRHGRRRGGDRRPRGGARGDRDGRYRPLALDNPVR